MDSKNKQLTCFTIFLHFLLISQLTLANENITISKFEKCLVSSTTDEDSATWVKWVVIGMNEHPELNKLTQVPKKTISKIKNNAGSLLNRLLVRDCKTQFDSLVIGKNFEAINIAIQNFEKKAMRSYLSKVNFSEFVAKKAKCDYCIDTVQIPNTNSMIGKYEVTQMQWTDIMGYNPSKNKDCGKLCPVENISSEEIHTYINKLNLKTGLRYRLPTENEWRAACQAGENPSTRYCGEPYFAGDVGWYKLNSNGQSHSVGKKRPNAWGLYDMTGNVWEATKDFECRVNKYNQTCGSYLLLGGGFDDSDTLSSTNRPVHYRKEVKKNRDFGFRLLLDLSK
jgi:Sulfatase-modifying factor enzyme 1